MSSSPAATPPDDAEATPNQEAVPGGVLTKRAVSTPFQVHLDVFSGPFDLLLGLIAKHKLDVTEIALHKVTDEFIAHIRQAQKTHADWDLGQASEFLLIAATLLDLKAARLLPNSGPEDEEDLALIEARDLLFARLLQYRAYKQVAAAFDQRMATAGRITARQAGLEEQFAGLLPELVMNVTPEQLAMIAAAAMVPKAVPSVGLEHLHQAAVSVREQADIVATKLKAKPISSFRELVADANSTLVIVARFLAVLELFKEAVIVFEQVEALGDLTVRWTADADAHVEVSAEFDEDDPAPTSTPNTSGTDEASTDE
ncbi:ScpA family protein [Yimella sp. cx-51]|uniref:segregation and condensation protein A n=1 Tax=Yimella sp. cx-51 TaxID=2770551 RepID=UPI00165D3380|nr:segregation/condensation protein A [Yimella sp. cx-51]QTH36900.1 segregation/condensation protein A [Yimella sp. cx-51]